jgi:starch phosphorylase
MTPQEALEWVAGHCIFTTHTPVPAGNDAFSFERMDKYFGSYYPHLKMTREQVLELGADDGMFSMTVLGLRLANQRNGVSEIHGRVSRGMWAHVFSTSVDETPIGHITNGVHTASWLAPELLELFNKYLGEDWYARLDDPKTWTHLREVPDARLWEIMQGRKRALIEFTRGVLVRRLARLGASEAELEIARHALDPHALTIGFARRFATYKRAVMVLSDLARVRRMVNDQERPVQFVFAGKAHPADAPGQDFIRAVVRATLDPLLAGKVVFLEDYGIDDARMLVQGVDVWLNTPRKPLEASGTSGEKAALNGVLNASILDGWWAEGFNGTNGFAIGEAVKEYPSEAAQDEEDTRLLYEVLETQIVPLYFERGQDGIPHGWIERSKESIRTLAPQFSTRRMLKDYAAYYVRAMTAAELTADGMIG